MYVLASVRIALRALRVNKLRSALTMLGIIIGVGAVIAMVAVGSGAAARIEEQIASIGSNLLIVLPGAATSGGMRMGYGSTHDPDRGRREGHRDRGPRGGGRQRLHAGGRPDRLRQPELVHSDPGDHAGLPR